MFYAADAHCDTLTEWVAGKRDTHVTGERMREGNLRLQVFAMFSGNQGPGALALEKALAQLEAYPALCKAYGLEPNADLSTWKDGFQAMLSIEGGEILQGSLERLDFLISRGVRLCGITWNHDNELGHSCKTLEAKGLTAFGRAAVGKMNARGVAVDVSHVNEKTFWDVLEVSSQPIIATHSCAAALRAHPRNLTDAQLKALAQSGGHVGVCFFPWFLVDDGKPCTSEDVANHIDHMVDVCGIERIGLGSDFDGMESVPADMKNPSGLPALFDTLFRRGYSDEDVQRIAGDNFIAYLQRL